MQGSAPSTNDLLSELRPLLADQTEESQQLVATTLTRHRTHPEYEVLVKYAKDVDPHALDVKRVRPCAYWASRDGYCDGYHDCVIPHYWLNEGVEGVLWLHADPIFDCAPSPHTDAVAWSWARDVLLESLLVFFEEMFGPGAFMAGFCDPLLLRRAVQEMSSEGELATIWYDGVASPIPPLPSYIAEVRSRLSVPGGFNGAILGEATYADLVAMFALDMPGILHAQDASSALELYNCFFDFLQDSTTLPRTSQVRRLYATSWTEYVLCSCLPELTNRSTTTQELPRAFARGVMTNWEDPLYTNMIKEA